MEKYMGEHEVDGCVKLLIYFFFIVVLGSFWGDYSVHYWLHYFGIEKTIPYFAILIASIFVGGAFWTIGFITWILSFVL